MKKLSIVLSVVLILSMLLAACGAGAYFYLKNKNSAAEETAAVHIESEQPGMSLSAAEPKAEAAAPENIINSESDMNRAITNALAKQKKPLAYLKGVNWFCSSELANDTAFKNYMQNLDNTLKQNLKNNIMGLTEAPEKDEITAKLAVDNNRNLIKAVITESSNSEETDKIVLQSINETFEGEKSPILSDSPLKADMYYFKVVIKL